LAVDEFRDNVYIIHMQVAIHLEKSGEDLQVEFPFVIATVPHKETAGAPLPDITYGNTQYTAQ